MGQEKQEQVKKCITFIFLKSGDRFYPIGTGFFVGAEINSLVVDIDEIQDHYFAVYLVTAKHVLQDEDGHFVSEIYIRLNRKGQRAAFVAINLKEQKLHVHEDENVDIAIFMFYPPQEICNL